MKITDVNASNVEKHGFFCYMSKKKAAGYQNKLSWLRDRFAEGMRIKLLELPDRGFIEYIPGEYAWRTIDAKAYMVIHCLWVVGKSKGKGYATKLLKACIADAKKASMKGVAMVTSEKVWMLDRPLLEKNGFDCVAEEKPFSLMVKRFGRAQLPKLIDNTASLKKRFPKGLTVIRSAQCPYIEDATKTALDAAKKAKMKSKVVELDSAEDVRKLSPSPYGTFGMLKDGELLSYHYLLQKDLSPLLAK
jgi:GNAT superfamily N-acetyltransferase